MKLTKDNSFSMLVLKDDHRILLEYKKKNDLDSKTSALHQIIKIYDNRKT